MITVKQALWLLASLLLPFSAGLHFLELGYYSPIAIVVLAPVALLLPFTRLTGVHTRRIWLLLAVLLVIFLAHSSYYYFVYAIDEQRMLKRIMITLLGMAAGLGALLLAKDLSLDYLTDKLLLGVDLCLLIVAIEAAAIYGFIPFGIKDALNSLFAGRITPRIQGPAQEASYLAQYLAMCLPIAVYSTLKRKGPIRMIRVMLVSVALLKVMSFQGFAVIIGAASAGIFVGIRSIKKAALFTVVTASVGAVILAIGSFQDESDAAAYHNARLENIKDVKNLSDILYLDASVYIRTMSPIYGLRIAASNPAGVGAGQIGYHFRDFLDEVDWDRAEERGMGELIALQESNSADTKGLVSEYFGEIGYLALPLALCFLYLFYLIIVCRRSYHDAPYEFLLSAMLLGGGIMMTINGGSFFNLLFWLSLSLAPTIIDRSLNGGDLGAFPQEPEPIR
jgi:hypothetical protein